MIINGYMHIVRLFLIAIIFLVNSDAFAQGIIREKIKKEKIKQRLEERAQKSELGAGDIIGSIVVDGRERTYVVHTPPDYDSRKNYPLVLVFHGGAGSGKKVSRQTGFNSYADSQGFILVYPDGIEHNWNDGRGTSDAEKLGVDDVRFVRALIDHLKSRFSIDIKRIYATGVSNGGIFVQRLGCEMADVFAAIGSAVGPMATNMVAKCSPSEPISVVAIQGTDDPFIPIQGGEEGWKSGLGDGGLVESARNSMKLWALKDGCAEPEVTNILAQVNDGTWVEQIVYGTCRNKSEVRYYIVHGMGHIWPPKSAKFERISGKTSQNIDATKTFLEFFLSHPKQ